VGRPDLCTALCDFSDRPDGDRKSDHIPVICFWWRRESFLHVWHSPQSLGTRLATFSDELSVSIHWLMVRYRNGSVGVRRPKKTKVPQSPAVEAAEDGSSGRQDPPGLEDQPSNQPDQLDAPPSPADQEQVEMEIDFRCKYGAAKALARDARKAAAKWALAKRLFKAKIDAIDRAVKRTSRRVGRCA